MKTTGWNTIILLSIVMLVGCASNDPANDMSRRIAVLESSNRSLIDALKQIGDQRESRSREVEGGREIEVLKSVSRSLIEELNRINEDRDRLIAELERYRRRYPPIDRKIVANIVDIRVNDDGQVRAKIDAGQRDGVMVGFVMTIGDANGNYVGTLRIVVADLNHSVGFAEDPHGRSVEVKLGDRAFAFPD